MNSSNQAPSLSSKNSPVLNSQSARGHGNEPALGSDFLSFGLLVAATTVLLAGCVVIVSQFMAVAARFNAHDFTRMIAGS